MRVIMLQYSVYQCVIRFTLITKLQVVGFCVPIYMKYINMQ